MIGGEPVFLPGGVAYRQRLGRAAGLLHAHTEAYETIAGFGQPNDQHEAESHVRRQRPAPMHETSRRAPPEAVAEAEAGAAKACAPASHDAGSSSG